MWEIVVFNGISLLALPTSLLSLFLWLGLWFWRGNFWRLDWQIEKEPRANRPLFSYPPICAVIPARNEAATLPQTLRSLCQQDYPGPFTIIIVDDGSTDGTADAARSLLEQIPSPPPVKIITANPLPAGWTGKLWALQQGIDTAETQTPTPEYFLLTDADIQHDAASLRRLVAKAKGENLDLLSVMVKLRCKSFWERLLIPAFVFFFQKIYPFAWVNHPNRSTAAAAGGCSLLRRQAYHRIGKLAAIRQALIDDCSLAKVVKDSSQPSSGIWLGLSTSTHSLRVYSSLADIWHMVARTAFAQLNYSPWLLLGTIAGMLLVYIVPVAAIVWGIWLQNWQVAVTGLVTWLLMAKLYYPTVRFYQQLPIWSFALPAIAFFYTLMTLDSAWRHWRGKGGWWKGRVYRQTSQ
ncbi:glycosyltransferase [Geitlerinema sp. PCC 9228]|uniref:glycosyltransferase n=1 Tax=Geitlerinema sp. PCC 9228 TaxID=111611 RepID=UPI000B0DB4C2|nr:glycosyltransferase [Geitlerinema sp. PCC 9228]